MLRLLLGVLCVWLPAACSDRAADAPESAPIHFTHICDGSAAVRIGSDHLLVAYDEKNALYLYSAAGGKPESQFSYRELLGINDKEVDVEAAAVVSDGVWWVGSHGRDGDGDVAPNRRLLFKTSLPEATDLHLQLVQPSINLYPIITDSPLSQSFFSKKTLQKKPKKGGLNIEGLVAESDDSLLLGLRSPLTKENKALIIRLEKNADSFIARQFYQLDLGERGIRDIQSSGDGYMLIAGDVASGGVAALYYWQPGSKAKLLTHVDRSLNPEALIEYKDHWLILSDDGKQRRQSGDTCDELADDEPTHKQVYFRAITMSMPRLLGNSR